MPRATTVRHVVEDLLRPAGDAHVVGIVRRRLPLRPPLPLLQGFQHAVRAGDHEVHHRRGAAGQCRERPALPGFGGRRAHERHFQMRVRVDAAGNDIGARGIHHLVAREVRPDRGDALALDQDVGLVGAVGGNDCAALDDCGHRSLLHLSRQCEISRYGTPASPRSGLASTCTSAGSQLASTASPATTGSAAWAASETLATKAWTMPVFSVTLM